MSKETRKVTLDICTKNLFNSFKKRSICVYILMFLAVCQCAGLLVAVAFWRNIREDIVEEKETELCYSRSVFETSFGNIEDKLYDLRATFNSTDNATMLCGPARTVFDILIFKVMHQLYNSNAHPEVSLMRDYTPDYCSKITDKNPIMKLVGIKERNVVSIGNTSKLTIFWKSEIQSYQGSGLRYNASNGHVHIEKSGLYFIMSQIRTKIRTKPIGNTHTSIKVKHRIHRLSQDGVSEFIVLENVKTLCEPVARHADQTSTVGAIFNIGAHEQVYVSTSHPNELTTGHAGSHLTILVL